MENFQLLGSVATDLHAKFVSYYYALLPVFFCLAVVGTWARGGPGGLNFADVLRRAVVATLLMAGFQEITDSILAITSGLADAIGDMSGLDSIIRMAGEKAEQYTASPTSVLVAFNDLLIAGLAFISFLFLYVARYITLALYHFGWVFLTLAAPFLLLFHLFSSRITVSLFRTLLEIASWRIAWAILSAMLKALPFGDAYAAGADYFTVLVMNLIIGAAMLGTPLVVHALVGGGFVTTMTSLGTRATRVMTTATGKVPVPTR